LSTPWLAKLAENITKSYINHVFDLVIFLPQKKLFSNLVFGNCCQIAGKTNSKGRFSTVELLVKLSCLVTEVKNILNVQSS